MKKGNVISILCVILFVCMIASACVVKPQASVMLPLSATATPFQPVMPTATNTPQTTATATLTPLPMASPTNTLAKTTDSGPAEAATTKPSFYPTQRWEPGMVTVPILLYHHISDTVDTQYNVKPENFAEQMKWLHDRGYSTITIADVARTILNGGDLPARPVVITFDDGYPDVYENAYPILEQYGYVATFYIISNTVDAAESLTTKKLMKLINSGWEIGCHSMTHADLTGDVNLDYEIRQSKALLEEKLGIEIITFAYPYGKTNNAVTSYTIDSGYIAAVGLGSIMDHATANLFFLHRKEIKSWYGLDFFEEFMPWTN
jgi:peptidoglycan/xylan/chitin deacetylase (PgdA/CDA1 family)